jgi:hypothetical protein
LWDYASAPCRDEAAGRTAEVPPAMCVSDEQVILFRSVFTGRSDVYGTYDPQARRSWQVKRPVTDQVIRDHLEGRVPYGVYLLDQDRIYAVVADFDHDDVQAPCAFRQAALKLGLETFTERSKSKGFHSWIFFEPSGVLASKARRVVLEVLRRIDMPQTEVFPKQDRLTNPTQYGNFINTPLFGQLVNLGRCVFLDENLKPCADQWALLKGIQRVKESVLDGIISNSKPGPRTSINLIKPKPESKSVRFALPPCVQRMLNEGVTVNQRVACFRLACQLRKIGFGFDLAVDTLLAWSQRNRPETGKGIITLGEIRSQARAAYETKMYLSCGCEDPAVKPFCNSSCPMSR